MKQRPHQSTWKILCPVALTSAVLGTPTAQAQERPDIDFSQFEGPGDQGWHVRVGGRALFNAKSSVTRSAGLPLEPGFYDNGSVRPDIGGTASGLTWNWGYTDASQVSGGAINYERYTALPDAGSFSNESKVAPGGEIMVGVRFGEFEVGDRTWQWGAELGGAYNLQEINRSQTASATGTYETAAHNSNGILVPGAPYQGTFNGPGPVIDLNPSSSSSTPYNATSSVDGSLKNDLFNFKLGVWLDMPITEKLNASFSTGFSSLYAHSEYSFTETIQITTPGVPAVDPVRTTIAGRNWQQGGYVQARLQYEFNDHWSAWAGAEYQYNGRFNYSDAGRNVELDFTALFSGSVGIQFSW